MEGVYAMVDERQDGAEHRVKTLERAQLFPEDTDWGLEQKPVE